MTQGKSGLGEFGLGVLSNTREFGVGLLLIEAWVFSVVAFACLPRHQGFWLFFVPVRAVDPAFWRTESIDCGMEGPRCLRGRVRVSLGRRNRPASGDDDLAASRDVELSGRPPRERCGVLPFSTPRGGRIAKFLEKQVGN